MVFPDGTTAAASYERLKLEDARIHPYTSFSNGCASDLTATSTFSRVDWVKGHRPVAVHRGPEGGRVEVWPDIDLGTNPYNVVYRFGRWTVVAHAKLEDAEACARALRGWEVEGGWIRLEAVSGATLASVGEHAGPEVDFWRIDDDPDRGVLLFPGACAEVPNEGDVVRIRGLTVSLSEDFASWCDRRASMRVHVYGPRRFSVQVARELRFRNVRLAS